MADYDELTFLVRLGDVDAAAVLTFAVKENSASSTSSPTPTAVTLASATASGAVTPVLTTGAAVYTESSGNLDNLLIAITVKRNAISKRYVFLSITATVESYEVNSLFTIQSCPRSEPVTQGSTVLTVKYAANPRFHQPETEAAGGPAPTSSSRPSPAQQQRRPVLRRPQGDAGPGAGAVHRQQGRPHLPHARTRRERSAPRAWPGTSRASRSSAWATARCARRSPGTRPTR
jgi:hypothetical protein